MGERREDEVGLERMVREKVWLRGESVERWK